MNLGVDTSNFYKFTCTLSLCVFIFCISFESIFLIPYNDKISELNIQKAELSSDIGYYNGLAIDVSSTIKNSIILDSTKVLASYYYYTKKDTSDIFHYYSSTSISNNEKQLIDSLNIINKKLSKAKFKSCAINQTSKALEKNISYRLYFSYIIGVISFLIFVILLYTWYKKRESIDNRE